MPRFSANLSTLFLEHAPLERPRAARQAGFDAVEVQFPYEHPPERWKAALERADMSLVLFNLPVGDMMQGGSGFAAVPGHQARFREALDQALAYAETLRPRCVNVLAGWPGGNHAAEDCLAVFAQNLALAAQAFSALGVQVLVEPINTVDRPGSLVSTSRQALEVIALAGHANLAIQYDIYHMQIMEGDLIRTLGRHHARIGHIQFADNPGRAEPGTGEINFANVFAQLDRLPYAGFVGAEYLPSGRTECSLDWLARVR